MTPLETYDRLISSVEAVAINGDTNVSVIPPEAIMHFLGAYAGSLDAALSLKEALLPGWDLRIETYEDDSYEASVSHPLQVKTYDAVSPVIARALLLAILKAKRSELEQRI